MKLRQKLRILLSFREVVQNSRPRRRVVRLQLEGLETRALPSVGGVTPAPVETSTTVAPLFAIVPESASSTTVRGYTPQQIRTIYGVNQLGKIKGQTIDGAGETIAIVDAFNDPNILSDANHFSSQKGFSLPTFNSGGPTLKVVGQNGGPPPTQTDTGWAGEISLDVEWAHAIAPKANILLVEAKSANLTDLDQAVKYAAAQPKVVAVSMSWGGPEFNGEATLDGTFTSPSSHGVTFVAASGDSSAYYLMGGGPTWPSTSPNVLAVGGTSLRPFTSGGKTTYTETGWGDSGGGISEFEKLPTFQNTSAVAKALTVQLGSNPRVRTAPDVAFDADPNTGFAVYDSLGFGGQKGWVEIGGTSAGTPQWSAIVALADQQRLLQRTQGGKSLDNLQVETTLYNTSLNPTQYVKSFQDIQSGSNGYKAGTSYDLVGGLGSPKVNVIVPLLAGTGTSPKVVQLTGTNNPGGFRGPVGSTSQGGFGTSSGSNLAVNAGRATGGGLYVNTSSPSITVGNMGGAPLASLRIAPVAADVATSASSPNAGERNALSAFNVTTAGSSASRTSRGTGLDDSANASVSRDDALFGASGSKGSRNAWRLSSLGLHAPLVHRIAGEMGDSFSDKERDTISDSFDLEALAGDTSSSAGAPAGSGEG